MNKLVMLSLGAVFIQCFCAIVDKSKVHLVGAFLWLFIAVISYT